MKECNYMEVDEKIEDLMSDRGERMEWMKIVRRKLERKKVKDKEKR